MVINGVYLDAVLIGYICAAAFAAGLVKGIVGFAMPMVMMSLVSSVTSPGLALATLIGPTVVTNVHQAMRQGAGAAIRTLVEMRVFALTGLGMLFVGAALINLVAEQTVLMLCGAIVFIFASIQLTGWTPPAVVKYRRRSEVFFGAIAGFFGGMSGIWGPPTVLLLTTLNTPKEDHLRIQGVIYGMGAVALVAAHLSSGLVNLHSALFSASMVVPAMIGMQVGLAISDRFDQASFRRATLIVLIVAALNLLRRALFE